MGEENKLIYLDNAPLNLTPIEYNLALYFFSHIDELSREQLLAEVWGQTADIDTRTVDTFIARLRKHLKLEADSPVQIKTLRGYGYRMEETHALSENLIPKKRKDHQI